MDEIAQSLFEKMQDDRISSNDKLHAINCLIQIKKRKNEKDEDLYWLTKELIKLYILGVSEKRYAGYDNLNLNRILKFVSFFELNQEINLLKFASRTLKFNEYEEEAHQIDVILNRKELPYTWKVYGFKRPFKLLFHLTTFNFISVVLSILLIPILGILIFYPFNFRIVHLFNVSYQCFNDNIIINHISNCLMTFVGMEGIVIEPTGILGAIIILIGKTMFFVIVLNFLLDKMSKYLIK